MVYMYVKLVVAAAWTANVAIDSPAALVCVLNLYLYIIIDGFGS